MVVPHGVAPVRTLRRPARALVTGLALLCLLLPALASPAAAGAAHGNYVTHGATLPEACPGHRHFRGTDLDRSAAAEAVADAERVLASAAIHIKFLGDATRLVLDVKDTTGTRPYVYVCIYDNGALKDTAGGYGTASSFRSWDEIYAWVVPANPFSAGNARAATIGTWEALW